MASYIIAGKADDPSLARAEFCAKQIEAACPNIYFHFEMKHPDQWKEFINSIFRKYDFTGYSEDFAGPLVWTHEGQLVGGSPEFVQHVYVEKFGLKNAPPVTDPMFKEIAADNLKQVILQLYRDKHGPGFGSRCDNAHVAAVAAGLLEDRIFDEKRRMVVGGANIEVWVSSGLDAERALIREAHGDGQPELVDAGLAVHNVGLEQSHTCILHPRPIVRRHMVLVPRRQINPDEASPDGAPPAPAPAPAIGEDGLSVAAPEKARPMSVPPHGWRSGVSQDGLAFEDFRAASEVLNSVGGIALWMGLRGATEYRRPLDTHLEVMPFPIHSAGEECPLRYPLELRVEGSLKGGAGIDIFPFRHFLAPIAPEAAVTPRAGGKDGGATAGRVTAKDLANAQAATFKAARESHPDGSFALAFTSTWMLLVPLEPPEFDTPRHEAWLRLPPPPPCCIAGVVITPPACREYPETAGLPGGGLLGERGALVSTRADEEGIPEEAAEYEDAKREVRVASRLLDSPIEILSIWARPK